MTDGDQWVQQLAGRFVVFDGPDGSGKTTQFHRFARFAAAAGLEVCEVREPGGTGIGEQIRRLLLDPANEVMDTRCEVMMYMASRAQLVAERIRPALQAGQFVLADRFISSTLAYQGTAGGMPADEILRVGQIAVGDCWPDLTVIFNVDESTAASRLSPLLDRMEQKGADYHRRVREGYLAQVNQMPDKYALLDARPDAATVFNSLRTLIRERLMG